MLAEALAAAEAEGIRGRDVTPFLLARFHERTDGESLRANVRLVIRNAGLHTASRTPLRIALTLAPRDGSNNAVVSACRPM